MGGIKFTWFKYKGTLILSKNFKIMEALCLSMYVVVPLNIIAYPLIT